METLEIEQMIQTGIAGSEVTAVDMTGSKDHFRVQVTAAAFAGKPLLEQHRMVQKFVQAAIDDGRIHAISFITTTGD